MKKTLILLVLVVMVMSLTTSMAMAGGWMTIGDTANSDSPESSSTPNNGLWSSAVTPHLGFSTSSNKCKVCHAVHDAEATSYRLLHNSSRLTECNWCHDAAAGVSKKRPYQVGDFNTVRGEHHLGSTVIPEDIAGSIQNSVATDGLVCGNCHSVHGAKVLDGGTWELNTAVTDINNPTDSNFILKNDPAENGGNANVGTDYNNGTTQTIPGGFTLAGATNQGSNSSIDNLSARIKTAFCADCHNGNVNQDDADDVGGARPNKTSHVQGAAADGTLEVYGDDKLVANFGTFWNAETTASGVTRSGYRLAQNTVAGCRNCHQARDSGFTVPYNGNSAWPHQSRGSKFLIDNYTTGETGWKNASTFGGVNVGGAGPTATTVGQTDRLLNLGERDLRSLDKVCFDCHRDQRGLGTDTQGVGLTF